jgi:hypothetical protein
MINELYRCIGKNEIIKLISGEIISNIDNLLGLSFTRNKNYAYKHHYDNKYPNEFILTYNYDIIKQNFQYIEYEYTHDWAFNNLDLIYNIYGGTIRETFDEYKELVYNNPEIIDYALKSYKSMKEVLVKEYWFISGLILNIEDRFDNQQNIEWLYNFIKENQDKLNLYL